MKTKFDVVIVGAGPGGSEMAFQLATLGIPVAVLEKGPLLREKSCGGGIQTQEIEEFGRPPEAAIERWITTAKMFSSKNDCLEIPQSAGMSGATVKRLVYDGYLQERAKAAGASFLPDHKLVDVGVYADRVDLLIQKSQAELITMQTRLLVYAAGSKTSPLKRKLGIPKFDSERTYLATQAWIQLDQAAVDQRIGNTIELYGGSKVVPEGYGWIFPKREIISIGLGTSFTAVQRENLNLRELLNHFMQSNPIVKEKIAGGTLLYTDGGLIPARCLEQLVFHRVLLLGDSAGVSNALHGGGIYQARKCAKIAAPFIERYIASNQDSYLLDYEDGVKQHFWEHEGRWDNKMIRFFHKDILLDSAISLGATKPQREISQAFSIILNSTQSHEDAYYIFEKAMLDIVYRLFEIKAEPYRKLLEDSLAARGYCGPLLGPSIDHILFADAKRFRATLAFLAYEMFSQDLSQALPIACAYELLHTASLIHDDVMDDAKLRRGRLPVHKKYGVGAAITSGDLLIFEAFSELLKADWRPDIKQRVCELFSQSGLAVSRGQGVDLFLTQNFDAWSMPAYLQMIKEKTGGLIESPLVAGGIVGGATDGQLALLAHIGTNLGMAFQIIDDSNDLLGTEDSSLKSLYNDLEQGKCTAIMVRCYELADDAQRQLIRDAVGAKDIHPALVKSVLDLCRHYGAVAHSQALCGELASSSAAALEQLPDTPARRHLEDINNIIGDWCSLGSDVKSSVKLDRPLREAILRATISDANTWSSDVELSAKQSNSQTLKASIN